MNIVALVFNNYSYLWFWPLYFWSNSLCQNFHAKVLTIMRALIIMMSAIQRLSSTYYAYSVRKTLFSFRLPDINPQQHNVIIIISRNASSSNVARRVIFSLSDSTSGVALRRAGDHCEWNETRLSEKNDNLTKLSLIGH